MLKEKVDTQVKEVSEIELEIQVGTSLYDTEWLQRAEQRLAKAQE